MEKKMTFNYFYGTEADQFSFYRIPKALFTDSYFKGRYRTPPRTWARASGCRSGARRAGSGH